MQTVYEIVQDGMPHEPLFLNRERALLEMNEMVKIQFDRARNYYDDVQIQRVIDLDGTEQHCVLCNHYSHEFSCFTVMKRSVNHATLNN